MARSIMFTMNVPKQFWGEAVLTTSYLINRMPSKVFKYQTPCQTFLLSYPHTCIIFSLPLKVFGCTAFVHIYQQSRSKLDPKAIKCLFLGYSPSQKGYKCYSPTIRNFYISMDITFFETQAYYLKPHIQGENSTLKEECSFWPLNLNPVLDYLPESNTNISPKINLPETVSHTLDSPSQLPTSDSPSQLPKTTPNEPESSS